MKRYIFPISILLLTSLGCRLTARLSPVNILKTVSAPDRSAMPVIEETVKRQATATPTLIPTATLDYFATGTVAARGTAIHQTAQAQPMAALVQKLKEDGSLTSTGGSWHRVDNFDQTLANTDGYHWWNIGVQPIDFVIRANLEWWSTDASSDLFNSGCGFVFRTQDQNNFLAALFTLDGRAHFDRRINGEWLSPILSDWIPVDPTNDQAEIMLIVEGNRLIFFKEGSPILDLTDDTLASPKFQGGDLAIGMISGTNVGFGLRCELTDVDLWVLR